MFGSLVVIFPTSFDGGELIMKRGDDEWSFDASRALSECLESPHITYVALYSDVEHEVSMVRSGHRISVTYNLYFDDGARAPAIPVSLSPNALGLKNALDSLLLDVTFLPKGGWLGFNLEHKYPVKIQPKGTSFDLDEIKNCLKGFDAEVVRIAKDLSLHVSLRAFVSADYDLIAFEKDVPDLTDVPAEEISGVKGAVKLQEHVGFQWIKKASRLNQYYPVDVHGNEPAVDYEYKSFCLFVEVGKPGTRSTPPEPSAEVEEDLN